MKALIALEKLIKDLEKRISIGKAQLIRHESGEEVLTLLVQSSVETNLEKNLALIKRYRNLMKEFNKFNKLDSSESDRIKTAIERKKYYKYSREGIEKSSTKENDEKIEAALILNELPEMEKLEEREVYEIGFRAIESHLFLSDESEDLIQEIREVFQAAVDDLTQEHITNLEMLNYMIPTNVFHFELLLANINQTINETSNQTKKKNITYPKYHDWWLNEMWTSHKAYFALCKWKKSICDLCLTDDQEFAWNKIFHNWMFIKSLLNEKDEMAFEYQYIFDSLLHEYVHLESELDENRIKEEKKEIEKFIENEDFFSLIDEHDVITPYLKFKDASE